MSVEQSNYFRQLRQLIDNHFSLGEIRDLCFNLGIDYEHLPGKERREIILSLLLHLARRGQINRLLGLLQAKRSNVVWPEVPPEAGLAADLDRLSVDSQGTQSGSITIHGNVGPGAAIGHGASVEAKNIAGEDIHDSRGRPSLTWSRDIDFSPPSVGDTRAGAKRSWFIRLKVANNGQIAAENCYGLLLRVTDEQGHHLKRFDRLYLYWTRQDKPATYSHIDIRENGDFQYLDVAQVIEAENVMVLRVVIPDGHRLVMPSEHTLRPEVLLPGTYYVQIALYADNDSIGPTWFKVEWNDDYSIQPYPCSIAFDTLSEAKAEG